MLDEGRKDFEYIRKLLEYFVEEPKEGWDPTYYHTMTYVGDKGMYDEIQRIFKEYSSLC
jgi:ferritin-like protein